MGVINIGGGGGGGTELLLASGAISDMSAGIIYDEDAAIARGRVFKLVLVLTPRTNSGTVNREVQCRFRRGGSDFVDVYTSLLVETGVWSGSSNTSNYSTQAPTYGILGRIGSDWHGAICVMQALISFGKYSAGTDIYKGGNVIHSTYGGSAGNSSFTNGGVVGSSTVNNINKGEFDGFHIFANANSFGTDSKYTLTEIL